MKVKDKVVFITVIGEELYAVDAVCPHARARCILGVLDGERMVVKCQCHHALLDLRTGEMLEPPSVAPDFPRDRGKLNVYKVRVNRGFVEIEVDEETKV